MLALFSPPVLLFDKCAFVCTLIQYISRFATCQANFSCKLRAREKKKAFSCSNLFDNGWKLSFWCGDSHDWDGASAESKFSGSLAGTFWWCGDRHDWDGASAESKLRFSFLCLNLSVHVATATTEMERSGIEVASFHTKCSNIFLLVWFFRNFSYFSHTKSVFIFF